MFLNQRSLNFLFPSNNTDLKNDWETIGLELLYRKDKFEFTTSEKEHIKKMLKESPPPLQYRRKVSKLNFIKNYLFISYGL